MRTRGHLPQTACQEHISLAYARAVAAAAGCAFEGRDIDYYGVDGSFHHASAQETFDPKQVEAQFKCTTRNFLRDDHVAYSGLKKRHHDMLRPTKVNVPRILVVMLVPTDMDDWLVQSEEGLVVAGCAYWVSLRDAAEITTDTTTVHLPRSQVFGVDSLLDIMDRVAREELL